MSVCSGCGQVTGVATYDDRLWDLYHRHRDGRAHREALVFDSGWLQENVMDDDDHAAVMGAMEHDMHGRGLCVRCGRPDLSGCHDDDFMDDDEAEGLAEMYAEQAAERRMGA